MTELPDGTHHPDAPRRPASRRALPKWLPPRRRGDTVRRERHGQPVGQEALERLRRAVAQIGEIPAALDPSRARTGGVSPGRLPGAFADARLAAAAVLAAVEVQRRRAMV